MKLHDNGVFLLHIADSFEKIAQYLGGMDKESFFKNSLTQDAVVRNYEIIGEAARNITDDFRALHPEIDWRGMAGLRNILIHQYFGIDLNNVWNISKVHAPDTLAKIQALPEYQTAKKLLSNHRK
ncbi:MAG: hypothetical protein BWY31_03490 [Lentisphaerae bacterium ADurb.Bin242]|nr:MAG: hypothetical protein BWY31_03490 [Lentisphaerae bacterium ADurb.Bin242]